MSPLRDFFLAPATEVASTDAGEGRTRMRHRRRERVAVHSLGVVAGRRELPAVACSAALVLGARAPAVLVGLHMDGDPAQALRALGGGAATRLAGSLRARGLEADARGRLVVIALPAGGDEAATAWARASAAASDMPSVLGVSMRHDELDVLLAVQDAIVIAVSPSAPDGLAALALDGIGGLAPSASMLSGRIGPVARVLAVAGLWPARPVRAAVDGALR